jgi:tetratricopeptide (TPR) repeat protein
MVGCGSLPKITRTPPGTSAEIALARKAIPVEQALGVAVAQGVPGMPAVEPELPSSEASTERVVDAYNAGNAFLDEGNNTEAVLAFQRATKLNPNFEEAWLKLALCYQNMGQEKKALEILKRYKNISSH